MAHGGDEVAFVNYLNEILGSKSFEGDKFGGGVYFAEEFRIVIEVAT